MQRHGETGTDTVAVAGQVPIYDFKQSRRVGFRTVEVPTSRVVVVEGIYALSKRIRWGTPPSAGTLLIQRGNQAWGLLACDPGHFLG